METSEDQGAGSQIAAEHPVGQNGRRGRRWQRIVVVVVLLALAVPTAGYHLLGIDDLVAVFTGGSARLMCSAVFVGDRDEAAVWEQDFQRRTSPGKFLGYARPEVDHEARTVTADLWGLGSRTAVYRDGIGCTAAEGASVEELLAQGSGVETSLALPESDVLWPEGGATLADDPPAALDAELLGQALDRAFAEPDPERPRRTRAVVVVHDGRIVAERYAPGFDGTSAHLSNSVAKSVTATLIGILVGREQLDVDEPAPVSEWQDADDPRGEITLDQLLRMTSGLEFGEDYDGLKSDITMQYVGGDLAGYAAAKPLEAEPGTVWHYSTGTSNLLGRIVRETAGSDLPSGFAFPREALFDPLGMRTAVLEVDTVGNFVGGSSFYASARDYARLGLLYLRDGVWDGTRILPEGWVEYVTQSTEGAPLDRSYGAQFWLNRNGVDDQRRYPQLPPDTFLMNGHQGQHVVMVPSRDLVVVRTGLSEFDNWDVGELVADVLEAVRA